MSSCATTLAEVAAEAGVDAVVLEPDDGLTVIDPAGRATSTAAPKIAVTSHGKRTDG